jgi:uncharacterized protein YdeI (YjbR/CyaY-like superfamily)
MSTPERRHNRRYPLNHTIALSIDVDKKPATPYYLARILDAGVEGMRVEVTSSRDITVGRELQLSCRPVADHSQQDGANVALRCQVVWNDLENSQIGLAYMQ